MVATNTVTRHRAGVPGRAAKKPVPKRNNTPANMADTMVFGRYAINLENVPVAPMTTHATATTMYAPMAAENRYSRRDVVSSTAPDVENATITGWRSHSDKPSPVSPLPMLTAKIQLSVTLAGSPAFLTARPTISMGPE